MNFDDTPAEATFRAQVRAWIDANAPRELKADLESSGFGSLDLKGIDPMAAAKAWQKKKAEARKRQKVVEIKEIKLRPNIDTHDYEVKARAMHRFFEEGDKVKVTLRFRGRELAHPELGMKLLHQVRADFEPVAKVEYEPRMEGKQMIMILAPR